jgi:hypothetical protein
MPRTDLLRQLAAHLRSDNRAHPIFDYTTFNDTETPDADFAASNICGSRGCALGECPAIWPELWQWSGYLVTYKYNTMPFDGAVEFFNIEYREASFLFGCTRTSPLPGNATAAQVADHIETFCQEVEQRPATV